MTTSNGQPGQESSPAGNLAASLRSALAQASELRDQRPGRETRPAEAASGRPGVARAADRLAASVIRPLSEALASIAGSAGVRVTGLSDRPPEGGSLPGRRPGGSSRRT
jgi:hypothetical protein